VISKVFEDPTTGDHRRYEGIIERFEFCKDTNKWMYLVFYPEDDDREHMPERQVVIHLKQWQERNLNEMSEQQDVPRGSSPIIRHRLMLSEEATG
jgi:hypothetical protein